MPNLPKPERVKAPGRRHRVLNGVATPRVRGRKLQERNGRLYRRNPLCALCLAEGKFTEALEWDHVLPLADGGGETADNLQGLCRAHHRAKTIEEDKQRRGGRSRS